MTKRHERARLPGATFQLKAFYFFYFGAGGAKPEWYYYAEYDALLRSGYRNLSFCHEPMKGHKLISAASFERIITLLEAGRK